jgi:hypothetical protein
MAFSWGTPYACFPAKAGIQTGLPPSRENKDEREEGVEGYCDLLGFFADTARFDAEDVDRGQQRDDHRPQKAGDHRLEARQEPHRDGHEEPDRDDGPGH